MTEIVQLSQQLLRMAQAEGSGMLSASSGDSIELDSLIAANTTASTLPTLCKLTAAQVCATIYLSFDLCADICVL